MTPANGMSAGTKAGIGVGATLGLLAMAGLGLLVFLRKRSKSKLATDLATLKDTQESKQDSTRYEVISEQFKHTYNRPFELSGTSENERPMAELPAK